MGFDKMDGYNAAYFYRLTCLYSGGLPSSSPYLGATPAETLADPCQHLPKYFLTPADTCRVVLCAPWVACASIV